MMHDALRSDVLAALLADSAQDSQEAHADLREHAQHFREVISSNQQLATGEAKEVLAAIGPALEAYIKSAEEIVAAAGNDKARAHAMLPEFLKTFENLEEQLADAKRSASKVAHRAPRVEAESVSSPARWRSDLAL